MRKHSDERSETPHLAEVREYTQTLITPPDHVRVVVNLLYDATTRTARYQVEVMDPSTKELLALWSRPFHHDCTAHDALAEIYKAAGKTLLALEVGEPF